MTFSGLTFLFDEAAKSIRRNGLMSVAALSTVTLAMMVFGGAVLALLRLHQFVAAQPRQFEIAAFLRMDVARDRAIEVKDRVAAIPGVAAVSLVTREQALSELREDDRAHGTSTTDALGGVNPLPDRLDIRAADPDQTRAISDALKDAARFPEVDKTRDDQETLDRLLGASRIVRTVGIVLATLLFLATTFVIQNTVRLTVVARHREIRTMQLVGATGGFIRLPLVLEGIFYGVFGAAIAAGCVLFIASQLSAYVDRFQSPIISGGLPDAIAPVPYALFMLLCGVAIGWISSLVSIRRFLRRI